MSYSLTWEKCGVYGEISGELTYNTLCQMRNDINGDPRLNSVEYVILDLKNVQTFAMDEHHVNMIHNQDSATFRVIDSLTFIIIAQREELIQFAEYYISLAKKKKSSWSYIICNSLSEAREYLS